VQIEIDHDGYPTDASVKALRECSNVREALDAAAEYLNECGYGRARVRHGVYRLVTGGWSGCEDALGALHPLVRAVAWRSSHRGGLHVYALPAFMRKPEGE
jgi:hypothetical protein